MLIPEKHTAFVYGGTLTTTVTAVCNCFLHTSFLVAYMICEMEGGITTAALEILVCEPGLAINNSSYYYSCIVQSAGYNSAWPLDVPIQPACWVCSQFHIALSYWENLISQYLSALHWRIAFVCFCKAYQIWNYRSLSPAQTGTIVLWLEVAKPLWWEYCEHNFRLSKTWLWLL